MRLSELSANDKVLELGGGGNPACPGHWTNLDCRELPGVDIVADLNEPLPIDDESYDGVFSSYLLEHLSWRKVRNLISEAYRVIKTGGKAIFITSNLLEQARKLVETPEWNDGLIGMCFGDQNYEGGDWVFNAHHCGFSPEYAVKLFCEAGFDTEVKVHPDCKTDMVMVATKPPLNRYTWVRNEVGKLIKNKADAEILDIGCASCPITYKMKNCIWLDTLSYEEIAEDMKREGITPMPPEKFVQAVAGDLPFDNKQFEVAICSELLEHVDDPVKALKEIKRVSKHVVTTVPDEYSWSLDKKPFQNPGHLRHYTKGMLKQHLRDAKIKDYSLGKLDYQGWSYFIVVADLGEVSTAKRKAVSTSRIIFDDPAYWCGELGYRPGIRGLGYRDFPVNIAKVNHILAKEPGRVLDVGCAYGYMVKRLRDKGIDAWGIDISKYALEHAPEDVRLYLVHGSADRLPWEDKRFDMVVSSGTLEHIPMEKLSKAIAEIKRVAKRGIISIDTSEDPEFDNDITHCTKKSLSWWQNQFPPEFEIRHDAQKEWFNQKSLKVALLSTPVFTVPPKNYGGLELVVRDLAYALAKYGHQVTVFAPDGSFVEGCEMVNIGPPLEKVDADWMGAEKNAVNKVAERLMDGGFDIIHGHNWYGFEYFLKAQRPELKVCHTHHGHFNLDWWGASKPPWPLNLIAVSVWMQEAYFSQGFNAVAIYHGIALEDYPFKTEKGDSLLFVGRLDSFKRPHIAIDVAKRTGLSLDIVGGSFVYDVPYMEQIKQACDGKQIKLFLDAPHEKKLELYQNAKAVIFPSKLGEPFGLIVPEANACGTPVIATPDGAIPETLQDGVTGFICHTIDDMVNAVSKVDSIKPEDCRARVEKLFNREKMATSYVETYTKIIAGEEW